MPILTAVARTRRGANVQNITGHCCDASTIPYANTASSKDMSFTLQQKDLRPNFDLYQWIFADGEIVPGTSQKFQSFVRANPSLIEGATVILNSPGGSVEEGIRLGDAIRDLHFRTDVGVAGTDPMSRRPGLCLSACIYPYLGGEYRYLSKGSAIGILYSLARGMVFTSPPFY